jgi:hypothetical protein
VYVRHGPSGDDDDRRGVLLSDPGCTGGSELKAFAEGAVSEYRDTEDDDRMSNRGFLTRCRYRMVCQSGNGGFETGDGRTDQEVSELFAASQWGWDFAGGSRGQDRRVTTRWAEHGGDRLEDVGRSVRPLPIDRSSSMREVEEVGVDRDKRTVALVIASLACGGMIT